ncbi:tetratricopeptide repeat-containing glycosyltransferase family protein [Bradyrhizobium sp. BR 10289]|uniref:tetratricopeptide repeat-containing glycosyltransferase family protein n=1 Tax=Bradyrhizobium sp. BR 10289 TaxID=2749993 RepID=UPI001C64A7C6|nr:tetratricopeptide repeat-containing glycosyltransferase family protein [Bradyrhizobium sp. BR 10289]MBW7974076.1 glycosyltransferase family protein [Bradyrhizobium sp. BR 10289]
MTALSMLAVKTPAALCEAGLQHFRGGRHPDARACCEQALAIDAEHAGAQHLMGLLLLQAGQYGDAMGWIVRAIQRAPKAEYLASFGAALQRHGRFAEALNVLDKAIQLRPDDSEFWRQHGDILVQLKRLDQALVSFQKAIELDPHQHDALHKSGIILHKLGRNEEAIARLDLSDSLHRDHAPTLHARAWILYCLKRFEESASDGRRAHQLDPDNADTCNHLGLALRQLGRDEEALAWFDKAVALQPRLVDAFNNKLTTLYHLHRFDEVFALSDRMKALGLSNSVTEWNVTLARLLTGDFETGWRGHHTRLKLPSSKYAKFAQPMWLGEESLEGKTILVAADEGLGDSIHFARYVPLLAKRGARVLLAVQDPLHRLMSNLSGVSDCAPLSTAGRLKAFDLHCPISSLPLAFGTRLDTIPSAAYLPSIPADRIRAWDNRLGPRSKLRVGLVWSGDPGHVNDQTRSIPLRTLCRILDVDASFISLQKAPRPADAAVLRERSDIVDLTADLTDFTETAALVSCLDLVITVDTSVAHLAGALGRPTWILLPWTPDYRWLLDRDDSPWYPSVRLFRQSETREYESVLDRVRAELQARAAAFAAGSR